VRAHRGRPRAGGGEEPYVRVIGKGSVTRDCPLSPELVGVLESYLTTREARTGTPARTKDPVFLTRGWPR